MICVIYIWYTNFKNPLSICSLLKLQLVSSKMKTNWTSVDLLQFFIWPKKWTFFVSHWLIADLKRRLKNTNKIKSLDYGYLKSSKVV